jgi:transcriptional regulator with PAS, ATPase and Fis domain
MAEINTTNDEILGVSQHINRLRKSIKKAAEGDRDVLILGPTGTGKDVVSRAIHKQSPHHAGPFVSVNCAAIPPDLIDSYLYGHKRGAFTGADRESLGKIAKAEGGTLFLNEIGKLRPDHQANLLSFLETREYSMIGSNDLRKANIRIIAATNETNLYTDSQNNFRKDLYFRLNQSLIVTQALENRYEDVVFYINHFGKGKIDIRTKCLLYSYGFFGNVRELINLVDKSFDYLKGYIRMHLANELKFSNGITTNSKEDLYWSSYLQKYEIKELNKEDLLYATFIFSHKDPNKLEKLAQLYEIITLSGYTELSKEAIIKALSIRDQKLSPKTFKEHYGFNYPEGKYIRIYEDDIDYDDDSNFAKLPKEAMKLYPDFFEFLHLDPGDYD